MAVNRTTPQGSHIDLSTGARIKGMQQATTAGHPVEHDQFNNALDLKQDIISGGDGVDVAGTTVSVDLSASGTDYSTLDVGASADPSELRGTYVRASAKAYVSYAGLDLDMTYDAGNFAWYYQDNLDGTWDVLAMRSIDGISPGAWYIFVTTTDPSTITGNVEDLTPNYQGDSYDYLGSSCEYDENGWKVPSTSSIYVSYPTGSGSSYLKFESGKLLGDAATSDVEAATGKIADAGWVVNHVQQKVQEVDSAGETSFVNSVTQFPDNPTNVQTAIEKLKDVADSAQTTADGAVTVNSDHTSKLANIVTSLGTTSGSVDMGQFTSDILPDDSVLKVVLEAIADKIELNSAGGQAILGLGLGEGDFGTFPGAILDDNSDAKSLFTEIEAELEQLALGAGQFWSPVEAHSDTNIDVTNPATDTFGGEQLTAVDGSMSVLLLGQTDPLENGIWDFNGSGNAMTRRADADSDVEFTSNKTVQVLASDEEGISGATFAYIGTDSPVVGTDSLPFQLKSKGVVGDNSISFVKLGSALQTIITDKVNKYAETVTIPDTGSVTITHNLSSTDVVVSVKDSSGNFNHTVEIDEVDSNSITVSSVVEITNARVVVIG